MPRGSPQFTPRQLLAAGRRAEAEGKLDLAHQFYGHLSHHFGNTTEAAEGRQGLARIGAAGPDVWQMNGGAPAASAANGLQIGRSHRTKHAARRTDRIPQPEESAIVLRQLQPDRIAGEHDRVPFGKVGLGDRLRDLIAPDAGEQDREDQQQALGAHRAAIIRAGLHI